MPRYKWPVEPVELIRPFEERHRQPEAGALLFWAALSVDSLHYLSDVDGDYDVSRKITDGHNPDIVDVSHARWATVTCITALDVSAAALGRTFCGHTSARELALPDFDIVNALKGNAKRVSNLRGMLPPISLRWVDRVLADPRYSEPKQVRNWFTHARVKRHFRMGGAGPTPRIQLDLGSKRVEVRHVVEEARDLATERVSDLLMQLSDL